MVDKYEVSDLQERFAALPEITLPDSLCAEALFAKMDADQLATPTRRPAVVVDFMRRYRSVLSYAAAFFLLVVVYYGVGLDNSLSASPSDMQVASSAAAVADDTGGAAPANELMSAPRMAAAPTPEAEEEAQKMEGEALAVPDAAPPAAAPYAMTAAPLLAELELESTSARLEQVEDAVRLLVSCADSSERVFTQQGGYLYLGAIEGQPGRLLLATLTDADSVPLTGVQELSDVVAQTSIASYPGEGLNQYMVITVLDTATDTALRETAAVLGSRLILQPLGKGSYVIFSDTQPDAHAIASLALGGATIELR